MGKFYIVSIAMALFFSVIVFKVFDLQYLSGEKYRDLAKQTTIKRDTIFANRGNVYASGGNLLATSMSKYTIRMDVLSVDDEVFEKNIKELCDDLSNLLGRSSEYYQEKLNSKTK